MDPVAVWKKLSDQFQKKSWVNRLQLRRKLHSLRPKDGESVQEHIKTMIEVFNELSIVGDAISNEDRVVFLLASLPESFNMLVTALEANSTVPAMEIVTERLMHEERKRKDRGLSNDATDGALISKHRGRPKGPRCYGCQKFGHIQRNCPERNQSSDQSLSKSAIFNKKVKKGKGSKVEVHQTQVDSESSEEDEIGLLAHSVFSAVKTQDNHKKLDSGLRCNLTHL